MFKKFSNHNIINKIIFKRNTSKKELVDGMIDEFYKKAYIDKAKGNNIKTKKLNFVKEGMILSFQLIRKVLIL